MNSIRSKILLISVAMLFTEIFLIRWISTEIRVFAYVGNLVLLACFIGIGVGCYFADRKGSMLWSYGFIGILVLAVRSRIFIKITDFIAHFSDSVIWQQTKPEDVLLTSVLGFLLTLIMFGMIVAVFIPMGQILGSLFNRSQETIIAYSFNIVGSIAGTWLFALVAYFNTPPWVWLVFALLMGAPLIPWNRVNGLVFAGIAFSSITVMITPTVSRVLTVWSSYQKLEVYENTLPGSRTKNGYGVLVNSIGYMWLIDLSAPFMEQHLGRYSPSVKALYEVNQYELPYLLHPSPSDVLILGAGGGNDVAGALRQKVPRIDAVEIDAAIYRIGRRYHPERPYQQPNVTVHIEDARTFLQRCDRSYDVISFGLLDSHTQGSSYNNIRLDHYVYTKEALQSAKARLKPNGILCLLFMSERDWITERLAAMLEDVFEQSPLVLRLPSTNGILGYGGDMFIVGNSEPKEQILARSSPQVASLVKATEKKLVPNKIGLATDDWPYLYLEGRRIPTMHIILLGCLAILLIAATKGLIPKGEPINKHFMFLGWAFLLLEFQNISRSSLLFGATWIVNAVVISAILVLALVSNWLVYARRWTSGPKVWVGLGISVIICYLAPIGLFANQSYLVKATVIPILLNIPILFSGVIFICSFQATENKANALASNLLGAAIGGMSEVFSFLLGMKALMVVVAGAYLLAFFWRDSRLSGTNK